MTRHTPRGRARRATALALAGAAGALLAFAGSAPAAVYRPADSAAFQAALNAANSTPEADTIILTHGPNVYQPLQPNTISGKLTITADHAFQNPGTGNATLDGSFVNPLDSDAFTVLAGAHLIMTGITWSGASRNPFAAVKINSGGRFTAINALIDGHGGDAVNGDTNTITYIENSAVTSGLNRGIISAGEMTFVNSAIQDNIGGGTVTQLGGNLRLVNTVLHNNTGGAFPAKDCFDPANSTVASFDGDGTCRVARTGNPMIEFGNFQGGPTLSRRLLPGSPLIDTADRANCPTTDQRFFVRPAGAGCDIGPFEVGAVRDTTPPTCVVTALRQGPPKQQDVTLRDGESGIGPDGVRPEEVRITNGTVAFTPFATPFRSPATAPAPSNEGLVLTATKTDQAQLTRWEFQARDWAGNERLCK